MAPELDEDKQTGLPNPDQPEWYDQTLKDIQSLPETDEPQTEENATGPSVAEREANASPESDTSALDDAEKNMYKPRSGERTGIRGVFRSRSKRQRNILIAGGVSVLLSVFGLIAMLPTILMNTITDKLADTFIGRAKYAVEQRAELYVTRYVTDVIGGSMRTCGTSISKDCAAVAPNSNSLFGVLATNWRDNRIESKLFEKYGVEFRLNSRDPNSIEVYKNGDLLGDFGRRSVSREVIRSINTETKFEGIFTRRHVRSVLARKYGADKFCLIACKTRDKIDDVRIKGVNKIKLRIIARVAEVTSARTTAYMLCLATGCSQDELERNDKALVDEILKKTDKELVESLAQDIDLYKTDNLSQLIVRRTVANLLAKVGVEKSAQVAASAVPLAGQIYLAATIAEFMTDIDEKIENREISKYMMQINKQEAALYATQIISMSDDVQSFEAPIDDTAASFQFLNGFAQSRLWQQMNNVQPKSTIQCEDTVLTGESDPLVCPETNVRPEISIEEFRNNPAVDAAMEVLNLYDSCLGGGLIDLLPGDCPDQLTPRFYISGTLDVINSAIGFVGSGLINALTSLPIIGDIFDSFSNFVANYANDFFAWASKKVLPRSVDFDAEDQLAFDQMAMGYDVLGNDFGKGDPEFPDASGIGAVVVDAEQQAKLDYAINEKRREDIKEKSFFARYFDFRSPESLAANVSIASVSGVSSGSIPTISTGLKSFASTFSTAFGLNKKASAVLNPQDRSELFGVTQYAYPADSSALSIDPATLTPERCEEYEAARLASGYENEVTGETDYTVENPCQLDNVVVDSLTKIYDLDPSGTGGISPTPGGSSTTIDFPGLTGYALPCEGIPTPVIRLNDDDAPHADWSNIQDSGSIGTGSDGTPIKVYIREACDQSNVKTVFIGGSIHGSESGGQFVAHELLLNAEIPRNVRIIAVPEINKFGINFRDQNGYGGRVNANGVNLNRNFDYNWGSIPSGSGTTDYKGSAPESEPETQALVAFLTSLGRISLALHYHDNLAYVAAVGNSTPLSLAQTYANFTPDTPLRNTEGGRVFQRGSLDAWQNQETGTPTLLVEMGQSQSNSVIEGHVRAVQALLEGGAL